MQKEEAVVWLWAILVLLASLIFSPIWLVLLIGLGIAWITLSLSKGRKYPHAVAEGLVDWIGRQKYNMLAGAIALAAVLIVAVFIVVVLKGEEAWLTSLVTDLGGYIAIAGLVLGLPALGYAMVTDSAVGRIEDRLGMAEDKIEDIEREIEDNLAEFCAELDDQHFVQVFVPDRERAKLIPVYDPTDRGPRKGWGIAADAPQAITGSAWGGKGYLCGTQINLKRSKLRLTERQQEEYEDLVAIAAAPVLDEIDNEPVGVLTVFSSVADSKIGTLDFQRRHEEAASALVDVIENYIPRAGPVLQNDLWK